MTDRHANVRDIRSHGGVPGPTVSHARFTATLERRSVLDRAHRGDVVGALGRIDATDGGPRQSLRRRVATLLAVVGPGVVVMVADNDAGSVSTYTQVGHDHGLTFAAVLLPLAGCLFINQEMAARLGSVTGAGHARLIFDRFGRWWGRLALGDLVVLNLLVLVTELIGVALGLGYLGVSRPVAVPIAALGLIVLGGRGSFRQWERVMLGMVAVSLIAVPLLIFVIPARPAGPAVLGGWHSPDAVVVLLAFAGTTVAPWQLFFHQSNVVDKRITPRLLSEERLDTGIGVVLFLLGACALIAVGALTGAGHAPADAGAAASAVGRLTGRGPGVLFAVLLINGSLLGAAAVSLSTAYAIGDASGTRHSLHRRWHDARTFHVSRTVLIAVAAGFVLVPGAPLGLVTTMVQVLAAVLLPSALVFLLLLANDRAVLGPWTNPRWLNAVAASAIGALLAMSVLLVVDDRLGGDPSRVLVPSLLAGVVIGGVLGARLRPHGAADEDEPPSAAWTMPRLERLAPPAMCTSRRVGLLVLRGYLVVAAISVTWRLGSRIAGIS